MARASVIRPSADPLIEDQLCIARIALVDPAAVGGLYDRYGRVVFGVVQRIVDDPQVAGELTGEAFHVATKEARSYRSRGGTVPAWLLGIALRMALEWCRAHGRSVFDDLSGLASGQQRPVEHSPGEHRAMEQLRLALRRVAAR